MRLQEQIFARSEIGVNKPDRPFFGGVASGSTLAYCSPHGTQTLERMDGRGLVTEAATSGRAPGGAVEMMRRLKDSNSFLAYVNIGLTMAALIFSAVQIVR